MAADESTVDRIIAETLSRHGGDGSPDPDVWEAQSELYDRRTYDPALAGNEDYVLAEHYMLSRAMGATGQVPIEQMLAQIEGHAGASAAAPTSAAPLAIRKLAQGARDGEARRVRSGRPKPEFNPKAFVVYRALHKTLMA